MNVDEFDFYLPDELIAQTPLKKRDASRLMVLDPEVKERKHDTFPGLLHYLEEGDCLVLNNTKVLPARLYGIKEETGAQVEVLLLNEEGNDEWETLVKPAKRVKPGNVLTFGNGKLKAECISTLEHGGRMLKFFYEGVFLEILEDLGEMPLPPYIKEKLQEKDRYQTVYAKHDGSAAAPTAGLHFTEDLLQEIKQRGVNVAYITLHVGLGTFRPVSVDTVEDHNMHEEFYEMDQVTADMLNDTRTKGKKIVAVGTTSARTLESVARKRKGKFDKESGWTDIFIYPGYEFFGIDGMLTNFHLPKSTLVMLVSAIAGQDFLLSSYEEAVKERYRFFSFGDAMLIMKGSHHRWQQ
ncbi:tRNA preQ1(34) S-adenosylmethionine ribosyltransferase-isomerase QueA [Alteribacillus iranensis]|uniref:S-adenosylmethionine:tRNA ribosyltransferase-isomerase n=1 Tax=Alteribacillus iranensis TaxID=930128 RepID=A0A1I1Z9Z3_9BACI|nr:tRNA preQ1(34) S-adenosylmethionine ribosyltransferase-isomerase QueA [Alteribacillus iranensis]SFE27150.1 S-adenosylmethionine--tRNA ribosyltransferase-isomerase [Alteribacillus iranensis]